MDALRKAAARVANHAHERTELAAAIVNARKAGARPVEIEKEAGYDRNHVGRILKAAGLTGQKASGEV